MTSDAENAPPKKVNHEVGQDLSLLSVDEVRDRIELLRKEIERLQTSVNLKQASREAADRFFK